MQHLNSFMNKTYEWTQEINTQLQPNSFFTREGLPRLANFITIPLECNMIITNVGNLLYQSCGLLIKCPLRCIVAVIPHSTKLNKLDESLPTLKGLARTIMLIVVSPLAMLSTLTLGFVAPKQNLSFHHLLGVIDVNEYRNGFENKIRQTRQERLENWKRQFLLDGEDWLKLQEKEIEINSEKPICQEPQQVKDNVEVKDNFYENNKETLAKALNVVKEVFTILLSRNNAAKIETPISESFYHMKDENNDPKEGDEIRQEPLNDNVTALSLIIQQN